MKQIATVPTDALLTDTQAAGILGCSVTHFRNLVRLATYRRGGDSERVRAGSCRRYLPHSSGYRRSRQRRRTNMGHSPH